MSSLEYGIKFQTSKNVTSMEQWLRKSCSGKTLLNVGLSDDLRKKEVEIFFERTDDREKFKAFYKTLPG